MGNPLQSRRSAAERAANRQIIEITDKISSFDGLLGIVDADLSALEGAKMPRAWRDSAVWVELKFAFTDAAGTIPCVTGRIESEFPAVCQRCLEPFQLALSVEPRLLLLPHDEDGGDSEDSGFNVWELEDEALRVQDIVEELLVLAMPFSAMHSNIKECKAFFSEEESAEETTLPFAALRAQMDGD